MKETQLQKPQLIGNTNIHLATAASAICMVIIILIFIFAYTQNLNSPQDSFDEGWRLMAAKLIALGYKPYAEVYHVDPPLYPITTGLATGLATRLNNQWINSPAPSRLVSVLLAVFSACFLFLIGKRLYGPISGSLPLSLCYSHPYSLIWHNEHCPKSGP
jgi:4-amino-4-deoxy-L-arabinose transferase-like glycosyltransferase